MNDTINTNRAGTVTRENANASYEEHDFDEWVSLRLAAKPGMTLLDLGFGGGKQIRLLRDAILPGGKLYGVDLSADCVRHMRRFLAEQHIDHIEVLLGSMDDAPALVSGTGFDLIYSVYAFYYSADMVKLLFRLEKLLKPGGKICILGYGTRSNEQLIALINQTGGDAKPYSDFIALEQIERAAPLFSNIKCERLLNTTRFPNKREVMSWLASSELNDPRLTEAIGSAITDVITSTGVFMMTKETVCVTFTK